MTDLTQSNWYDAETHRVDFLGHTEPRRNDEMQEYLKRGGRLAYWPRAASRYSVSDAIDRALGLTPQMEKAAAE